MIDMPASTSINRFETGVTMRIGIVGTGLMAQEHIRNLLLLPETRIVALCDPERSSLDWAQRTLGPQGSEVATFTDIAAMVRGSALDAVVVASPNYTHAEVLEPLFDTSLHILCEKPVTTTLSAARRVVARAGARQGIFWVGMEYRFMPPVEQFIRETAAGRVGRLTRIAMQEHRFPFLPKVADWNRFNRNTGGTMVEKCCHFFDLMRLIAAAEPVQVFCSGAMDVNHLEERYDGRTPDIIDNAFAVVDFANGVRAMLDLCMFAEGAEEQEELTVVGDKARLRVTIPNAVLEFSPRVPVGQAKQVERTHVAVDPAALAAGHHHGATFYQWRAFLDAAAGRAPVQVTAQDGFMAVAMGIAAETSAAEKRVVSLAELIDSA
jgi:myo-inositol 2-dehydrogenase/D-chiro-inositol 1-dehydrogenase